MQIKMSHLRYIIWSAPFSRHAPFAYVPFAHKRYIHHLQISIVRVVHALDGVALPNAIRWQSRPWICAHRDVGNFEQFVSAISSNTAQNHCRRVCEIASDDDDRTKAISETTTRTTRWNVTYSSRTLANDIFKYCENACCAVLRLLCIFRFLAVVSLPTRTLTCAKKSRKSNGNQWAKNVFSTKLKSEHVSVRKSK